MNHEFWIQAAGGADGVWRSGVQLGITEAMVSVWKRKYPNRHSSRSLRSGSRANRARRLERLQYRFQARRSTHTSVCSLKDGPAEIRAYEHWSIIFCTTPRSGSILRVPRVADRWSHWSSTLELTQGMTGRTSPSAGVGHRHAWTRSPLIMARKSPRDRTMPEW